MIKLSKSKSKKITAKFPSLNELFEREVTADELGYFRIAVSCFASWLKMEDYKLIEQVEANIVNTKRINLFSEENYKDILLLDVNGEFYYSLENQQELQSIIRNSILNEQEETLINIKKSIVLEIGGENFTDIVTVRDLKELKK